MTELIQMAQNAYNLLEQFHISLTGLLVAALVFALAFIFAVREAASWFFKVDDVKRDIRRLHEITAQLEGEIKALQTLLIQTKEPLEKKAAARVALEAVPLTAPAEAKAGSDSANKKATESSSVASSDQRSEDHQPGKAGGFPIVH